MAKVRVAVLGTTGKSVEFDPKATVGATLGTDVRTPDGKVGTPASILAFLGITLAAVGGGASTPTNHHRLLQGLPLGDDHSQYTRKDTLTTEGDLYVRNESTVVRLPVGDNTDFLRVVAGIPTWVPDDKVSEIVAGHGIIVDDYDFFAPVVSVDESADFDWTGTHAFANPITVGGVAVVLATRTLTAGGGLTGGGDLSADRTFAVGAGVGITVDADAVRLSDSAQAALALAVSSLQPGDNVSELVNDVPYLVAADVSDIYAATFLTTADETGIFANSRQLLAGTNITFDDTTPGERTINASGSGGGVDSVVGTVDQIDVDDTDPANPVLSLAADVLTSLGLADTAVQPARQIISGGGLTGGGDLSADRTLVVGAGTGITVNADDVALSAATITSLGLADTAVQPARTLTAGAGLTGGGDLSANRTFDVGAGTGITVNANDVQIAAAQLALINGAIQASVLTTNGDLLTRAAGVPARIGIGSDGDVLTVVAGAPAWQAGGGGAVGANPTALVGLSAVNGSALTFLRSDGAPALDQGIAPIWTALHTFRNAASTQLAEFGGTTRNTTVVAAFNTVAGNPRQINFQTADVNRWILRADGDAEGGSDAGTNFELLSRVDAGTALRTNLRIVRSTGAITWLGGPMLLGADNFELRFGTGGDDLAIYHNGTNNFIDSNTGSLILRDSAGNSVVTVNGDTVTIPQGAPSLKVGGQFTGIGSGGATSLSFYVNVSSAATELLRLQSGFLRLTGSSDPTQPSSRFSHYTTDFATERGYWGYPTSLSDDMILRNIAGDLLNFRVSDNVTRLQINTATGAIYTPVNHTGSVGSPEVGFRILPQNIQNGNYTAVLGDSGNHIYKASGGAGETFTIPANGTVAYAIGTMLTFVNQGGGNLSIAITTDTLTMSPGGATGTRTLATNGVATALKVTSTAWIIWGTGLS